MNHSVEQIGPRQHRCTVCLVSWTDLSRRDITMLTTAGKCIGRREVWRKCTVYRGCYCIAAGAAHQACLSDDERHIRPALTADGRVPPLGSDQREGTMSDVPVEEPAEEPAEEEAAEESEEESSEA